MDVSEPHQEALCRVLDFADEVGPREWIGYVLWEVLERERKPVCFWPAMPAGLMRDMETLRDKAAIWFEWDWDINYWAIVPLDTWRDHHKTCRSRDAVAIASERMQQRDVKGVAPS